MTTVKIINSVLHAKHIFLFSAYAFFLV